MRSLVNRNIFFLNAAIISPIRNSQMAMAVIFLLLIISSFYGVPYQRRWRQQNFMIVKCRMCWLLHIIFIISRLTNATAKLTLMTMLQEFRFEFVTVKLQQCGNAKRLLEPGECMSARVRVERNCYFLKMLGGDNNDINKKSLNENFLGNSKWPFWQTHFVCVCVWSLHTSEGRPWKYTLASQLLYKCMIFLSASASASDGV